MASAELTGVFLDRVGGEKYKMAGAVTVGENGSAFDRGGAEAARLLAGPAPAAGRSWASLGL